MARYVDTETRHIRNGNLETQYSVSDFVNPTSFDRAGKVYVILNAGFVQAIVFGEYPAYSDQDALDEAADSGKLDGLQLSETELADYEVGKDSEGYPEYEGVINLGNASEPFANESLDMWILPACAFEEEISLMTFDRIMARLEQRQDDLEAEYQRINTDDPAWSNAYTATADASDAITLFRLMCNAKVGN